MCRHGVYGSASSCHRAYVQDFRPRPALSLTDCPEDDNVCAGDRTLTDQNALVEINECSQWNGSITVSASSRGESDSITFDNLESLTGDLIFTDGSQYDQRENLLRISASKLSAVEGQLLFSTMTGLEMPSFPSLRSAQVIAFSNIAFGNYTSFGAATFGQLSRVGSIIFNHTNVASIGEGWTRQLDSTTPDSATLMVLDNPDLTEILVQGYHTSDVDVNIQRNSPSLEVGLPDLMYCSRLQIGNVHHFTADQLQRIGPAQSLTSPSGRTQRRQASDSEDASSIANTNLSELILPSLSTIDGALSVLDNPSLATLGLSSLRSVGNLRIAGNSMLADIALPRLSNVEGEVNLSGPIRS